MVIPEVVCTLFLLLGVGILYIPVNNETPQQPNKYKHDEFIVILVMMFMAIAFSYAIVLMWA